MSYMTFVFLGVTLHSAIGHVDCGIIWWLSLLCSTLAKALRGSLRDFGANLGWIPLWPRTSWTGSTGGVPLGSPWACVSLDWVILVSFLGAEHGFP